MNQLSLLILERNFESEEAAEYVALTKNYIQKLGNLKAIQKLIQTLILSSEFVYRQEFGTGEADEHGRRMLSPRDDQLRDRLRAHGPEPRRGIGRGRPRAVG